jgi:hypothetical protein
VTVRKETPLANIDVHIGRQLKAIYDDVLNQPIPARFLDLLGELGADEFQDMQQTQDLQLVQDRQLATVKKDPQD